jgi:hypothetical protein
MYHNAWRTMLKSARWFLFIQIRVDTGKRFKCLTLAAHKRSLSCLN